MIHPQIKFTPPPTAKIPVTDTIHGFQITDYYRWLENKTSQEVLNWSQAQHNYTLNYINKKYPEVSGLKDEIRSLIDRDYIGSPFYKGNREFFYARKKGQQQIKLYTRIKGKEILIFDPEIYDSSGKASINSLVINHNGTKAAIGIQYQGDEIQEFRIIDTENGKVLGEPIKGLTDFSWTKDEKHAYIYVRTKEMIKNQIPTTIYLHKIGSPRSDDVFLYQPSDAKNIASIWDEEYEDITFMTEGDFYSNKIKIKRTNSNDEFKVIYQSDKYQATPHCRNGKIYILTNYEAPNFKLMVTDIDKPEFENWKEFYPESSNVLESYVITSDWIIIQYKKDVLSHLAVYNFSGEFVKELDIPEIADIGGLNYHKETNTVFVTLNTFTAPTKIFKLDGKRLTWEFFWMDKPMIDTKDIESKLVFYFSKDSTKIPLFIIYKKGVKLNGNNPTILFGYGGFNISMQPSFVGLTASFINRGGVYAIACLRGGNEYGENWHRNGMLHKKQNTFDDFISAAEYLINEKWTNPNKLAIKGGSNGGLLTGAVMIQRPDLFKAVVCAVPLLDMLRFHLFLIARFWIPEYGDPDKKEDFLYIMKYSPYHNIKTGFNYPASFIKAGENDSRVDPMHAKKFVAALQNNPGQTNPILLFVNFDSGHGSGQSIEQQIRNLEIEWRFVMGELGVR